MAKKSKKPSISRARPPKIEEPEVQRVPADDVVAALREVSAAIREGHQFLAKLAASVEFTAGPAKDDKTLPLFKVPAQEVVPPDKVAAAAAAAAAEQAARVEGLSEKRGRGRPPKHQCPQCGGPSKQINEGQYLCKSGHLWGPAVPAAATTVAGPPPAPAATVPPAAPPAPSAPQGAYKPPRPCPGCGKNLDDAAEPHSSGCAINKPAPAAPAASPSPATGAAAVKGPAAAPTLDDIRPVAISYTQKHGKEALVALLAKYGSANLSGVPEESRAGLLAALQEG